ncbi:MAG: arginine--tRNA ligase [Syntrophomonadaceae bacterium]|nr:arginine--tRNA ligase [Syntrophomonadaceae bacterium]
MNPIEEMREQLQDMLAVAIKRAAAAGELPETIIPDYVLEVPNDHRNGDFAANLAMMLARPLRMAPRKIAETIYEHMEISPQGPVERVAVAGAGFINFYLRPDWLWELPRRVCELDRRYGDGAPKHKRVQVEFVSANPTGNLHMGNARGGALGDSLANVLQKAGFEVQREFYLNDAGNQIEIFGESLEARYLQLNGETISFPEYGYAGQDVVATVRRVISKYGDSLMGMTSEERRRRLVDYALLEKKQYIRTTLERFGILYDCWFSESTLYESGKVAEVVEYLREHDYCYESDGAWWFKSTLFGDEKDEVLLRANGIPTYFAADIAYHRDKFERGFDWVIDIWGADHHGHVGRMKGAMEAIGYDPDRLDMLLMQLVRLYRDGRVVRMSKRTGTTVTLDELLEDVGVDAARFFFVMRSPDSQMDFDLELAKKQNQDNPVYYVQYAHARIMSIFRQATAMGVKLPYPDEVDCSVLGAEELTILRKIADFSEEIQVAARTMAPHRIARYVLDLAGMFHSFYNGNRVLQEDKKLQDARLVLMECCRICIRNGLEILGVSAPDRM